jgi:acylphosphatase
MDAAYIGDMTIARRIRIEGRVQGVFFRDWTVEAASTLGLAGWVRNRRDSSVEVFVVGPDDAVTTLIARCHEGPSHAHVDRVTVTDAGEEEAVVGFGRRPTV